MQQIQCALCGRGFLADENGAGTCPSCGFVAAPTTPAPTDSLPDDSLSAPAPSLSAAPSPSSAILPPPAPVPPITVADVPASSAPAPQVAPPAEPPVLPQPAVEASQPDAIEPPTYVLPIAPGEPVESTPPPPVPSSSLLPPPAPAPASAVPQPTLAADTIGAITHSQPSPSPALPPAVPAAPFPPLADPPQSAYAPPGAHVGPSAMTPMMPQAMPPAAPPRPWPIDPRTQAVPPGAYPSGAYPYGPGAYQYGQPPTAPYPMASPYSAYSPYSLPMPPAPSMPPAPERRSQAPWLVIGAIAAVLVLLAVTLLGLLDLRGELPFSLHAPQTAPATPTASPTALPTATPSAPVGFTAYKDAGGLYSLAYPSGWSKFDGSSAGVPTPTVAGGGFGVAIFADGATGASFGIEYLQLSYPGGAQAFDDDIFKSFAQDSTVTNRTGPTTVSIAGESWTQESADVAASGGSQHLVVEAVSHNDYTVGIFYGAPKAIYAAVESGSFQTMISTFRFLR